MSELIQFVVLQRSQKWVVKSREMERAFGDKRKAIHCAVELANESGKNGKPALVLAGSRRMNLRRFGPSAKILTRWQDPFLAGLPTSTAPRSTAPPIAPNNYRARTLHPLAGSLHDS